MRRLMFAVVTVAAMLAAMSGLAFGVSDGGYSPEKQHCTGADDNASNPGYANPDCRSLIIAVRGGNGHEYASAGTYQIPDGSDRPTDDAGVRVDLGSGTKQCVSGGLGSTTHPCPDDANAVDPASGVEYYMGADDNLDFGEHDSSDQMNNGPSDGGAIHAGLTPQGILDWVDAIVGMDGAYLLTHPTPLDAGFGMCVDGLCVSAQTQRHQAFENPYLQSGPGRNVADYEGKQFSSESCAHDGGTCSDFNTSGPEYVDPGVQVYEDPDAQASPFNDGPPYPLPALYVGTCGVIAGGGTAPPAPASAVTNGAGQIDIATGCG